MQIKYLAATVAAIALLAAGCNSGNTNSTGTNTNYSGDQGAINNPVPQDQTLTNDGNQNPIPTTTLQTLTVNLSAVGNSKETGTAALTEENGKTVVVMQLTGEPAGAVEPAHIHLGSCPNAGAVKYPLSNVVNGKSNTTLNVTLAQLLAQLPLSINVHESTTKIQNYTACGDILAQ